MRNESYERPWVEKLRNGEYLNKWNNFDPILIGGSYSEFIGIGEDKYQHCIDGFSGIGDVSWWITRELDNLTEEQLKELENICKYKTYLNKIINIDLVKKISNLFGCEIFHVYRTGDKEILNLVKQINEFYSKILNNSKNCLDLKTISFKKESNIFKILTFDEFKVNNNY